MDDNELIRTYEAAREKHKRLVEVFDRRIEQICARTSIAKRDGIVRRAIARCIHRDLVTKLSPVKTITSVEHDSRGPLGGLSSQVKGVTHTNRKFVINIYCDERTQQERRVISSSAGRVANYVRDNDDEHAWDLEAAGYYDETDATDWSDIS